MEGKGNHSNKGNGLFKIVALIGVLLTLIVLFAGYRNSSYLEQKEFAKKLRSIDNLNSLTIASILYSNDHNAFPYSPDDKGLAAFKYLYKKKYLDDLSCLVGFTRESNISINQINEDNIIYEGFRWNNKASPYPSALPLIWEKKRLFRDGRSVAFSDRSVRFFDEEAFQNLIANIDRHFQNKKRDRSNGR